MDCWMLAHCSSSRIGVMKPFNMYLPCNSSPIMRLFSRQQHWILTFQDTSTKQGGIFPHIANILALLAGQVAPMALNEQHMKTRSIHGYYWQSWIMRLTGYVVRLKTNSAPNIRWATKTSATRECSCNWHGVSTNCRGDI